MIKITITINEVDDSIGAIDVKAEGEGLGTPNEVAVAEGIREAIYIATHFDAKPGTHQFIDRTPQPNPLN